MVVQYVVTKVVPEQQRKGFRKRRIPCELFESSEFGSLPHKPKTLVAGGLRAVEAALLQIDVTPLAANYAASAG